MNLDPEVHVLLINIDSLSLSLSLSSCFCFPRKPAEVDEKCEELNSSQGCMQTNWQSSFPNMGVWTGKQLRSNKRPIWRLNADWPRGSRDTRQQKGRTYKEEKSDKSLGREAPLTYRRVCDAKTKMFFLGQLIWKH